MSDKSFSALMVLGIFSVFCMFLITYGYTTNSDTIQWIGFGLIILDIIALKLARKDILKRCNKLIIEKKEKNTNDAE